MWLAGGCGLLGMRYGKAIFLGRFRFADVLCLAKVLLIAALLTIIAAFVESEFTIAEVVKWYAETSHSTRNFFKDKQHKPNDLLLPAVIVVLTSAFCWGIAQLINSAFGADLPRDIQVFAWRLSVVSATIVAAGSLCLWPLISGVLAGTAIVLWNRDGDFVKLMELVGFAYLPLLVYAGILFTLFLIVPVEAQSENNGSLELVSYFSVPKTLWLGVLLALVMKCHFALQTAEAIITVVLPYCVYRLSLFLYQTVI